MTDTLTLPDGWTVTDGSPYGSNEQGLLTSIRATKRFGDHYKEVNVADEAALAVAVSQVEYEWDVYSAGQQQQLEVVAAELRSQADALLAPAPKVGSNPSPPPEDTAAVATEIADGAAS